MFQLATFLFIGTPEVIFILFIVLMVFGADKIPDIARNMGKGMRQLKDASGDIKSEIAKSAKNQGIETDVTKDITEEIHKMKEDIEDIPGSISRNQ